MLTSVTQRQKCICATQEHEEGKQYEQVNLLDMGDT